MKVFQFIVERDKRQKRNDELLKRMQQGDSLMLFDSNSSWFPPRPVIEKDKKAIDLLYGNKRAKGGNNKAKGEIISL